MLYENANRSLGKYAVIALVMSFTSFAITSCERDSLSSAKGKSAKQANEMADVQGIVKDADGKPLPGVGIAVEGTTRGTFTDSEGKFKMNVPTGGKLLVKSDGFKDQLIDVNSKYNSVAFVVSMTPGKGRESTRVIGTPAADGKILQATVEASTYNGEPVFTVVERQPEFPGGRLALDSFLSKNMKYPKAAARANVRGRVYLSFVVTTNGKIKDIIILKGLGFGIDEEALRVMALMPRWAPGRQDGNSLNVRYRLPIAFGLGKNIGSKN